jgi:hypothetical protein
MPLLLPLPMLLLAPTTALPAAPLLLAAAAGGVASRAGTAGTAGSLPGCDGGTVLHNGICSRPPPRRTAPVAVPTEPDYIAAPPPLINISLGRQLFCDRFLVDSMHGVRMTSHSAAWDAEALLPQDKAWETVPILPMHPLPRAGRRRWPPAQSTRLAYSHPYSGGLWWDEQQRLYRLWYVCSLWNGTATATEPWRRLHTHGWTGGCCYAESTDGRTWRKPTLDVVNGTNIVLTEISDGITVWRGPTGGWLMAAVPEKHECMAFSLYASSDGIHWTLRVEKSGPILDRSTVWYDALRSRWVVSIKDNFGNRLGGMQRRARSWWTARDLLENNGSQWQRHASNCGSPECPWAWLSADSADPPNPVIGDRFPPEIYNVDGTNYESVNLIFIAIFRGFGGGGDRVTGELNELHLGYSRDGFQVFRPSNPNATRKAFLAPSWPTASWHHTDVQSVGGGLVLSDDDTLRIYVSARSGLPHTGHSHSPGGNRTMGFATLRRDGFISADDTGELWRPHGCGQDSCQVAAPGMILTRPMIFESRLVHLFVNVQIRYGGFLQVEVLCGNVTILGAHRSVVGSLNAQGTVQDPDGFSSTRARITWPGLADNLSAVAGEPVQIRFYLSGVSLYSFWVAASTCGESRGWLGAGGPGTIGGRDLRGSCV